MAEEVFLVVDGNSLMNRAYYGLAGRAVLTAPDGRPTGAVYAFLNTLSSIFKTVAATHLLITFDRSEKTFRHQMFPEYKGTRKSMPEELALQFPILKETLDKLGYARMELAGYEADDLIGSLAFREADAGKKVVIFSGDRDCFQLIRERIQVLMPVTRQGQSERNLMDRETFIAQYEIKPEQFVDVKAIMGDSSDNIPGVAGIGEKGALKLIKRYGDLEGVYRHLDELKGAELRKLQESKDLAFFSRELATINCDVPLPAYDSSLLNREPDMLALKKHLTDLGFISLIERLGIADKPVTEAQIQKAERRIRKQSVSEFLAEASGKKVALAFDARGSYVFTSGSAEVELTELEIHSLWPQFKSKLTDLVTWDYKKLLRSTGEDRFAFPVHDCKIAAYLLNHLGGRDSDEDFYRALQAAEISIELNPAERKGESGLSAQAAALLPLHERQIKMLTEQGQMELYESVELPLVPILADMERSGIRVNLEALDRLSGEMQIELDRLESEITQLAGEVFNLNSSKQLSDILFGKLGLKGRRKNKDGSYSTAAEELELLRQSHPIIPLIFEYREYSKLRSTFVEGLRKQIAADGRIHSEFNQTLTATGRLSSSNPNLQNIPIRSHLAAQIRALFVASPGNVLLDADYSQIELRILAHLCEDENLQTAFREETDIHTQTASRIFMKDRSEVTAGERRAAKTVNFSIVYGISDFGLANDLGISVAEAKHYIQSYDLLFPKVRPWMQGEAEKAKSLGYVETLMHRRRYIPELGSSNYAVRQFGQRAAMNAPVQGTAADLIKIAMVRIDQRLRADGLKTRLLLQVHDELLLESPVDEQERASKLLQELMEDAMTLSVPLVAEVHSGHSWDELK